ncbi:MAG: three-Cys-motif partner protein TcmP [Planctomycetia bacterium]|nr:three-Cys-motif partner protein TcmP [Planctomycetia bacterium]
MSESVVGPWAKEKLDHLAKYLAAYSKIMQSQVEKKRWCAGYFYIDAFAGPGKHQVRRSNRASSGQDLRQALLDVAQFTHEDAEQAQFIHGSPAVALEVRPPFSQYIFVERSAKRVAALEKLKQRYGDSRHITIRQQECSTFLTKRVVNNPAIDWRKYRAFVFLDPFGLQVPWDTIAALAATRAIDILLNFPVGMGIQRLLPREPIKLAAAERQMLDAYFGSTAWYDVVYKPVKTLFGESEDEKIEASGERLLRWYQSRLRDAFGYVSRAVLIRNTHGGHLYYLMLASHKQVAIEIANHIFAMGEVV